MGQLTLNPRNPLRVMREEQKKHYDEYRWLDSRLAQFKDRVVGVKRIETTAYAEINIHVLYLKEEHYTQFISVSEDRGRACVRLNPSPFHGGICRSISLKNVTVLANQIHYVLDDGSIV